ncbi:helix-turn-helix domain-containing protein [Actinoplanes sp. DH11]|uniref:helix-turn-helix domain-containing protein n=1 Tax=Actinoplanes sp. DH11 TaxID=2857011 RepID=UPI001E5F2719|nr:helix-turn-helix domain-containing protein [Actinoplanes sp. DH11]
MGILGNRTATADQAELGPLLRGLRLAAGMTLEQLSQASGLSDRTIGDMERGVSKGPRASTVTAIAAALKLGDDDRQALAAAARAGRHRDLPQVAGFAGLPLPRAVPDFTGRAGELDTIRTRAGAGEPVRAILISGPPGIGKTSLALHAAAGLAADFPDGQYFVDLQGLSTQPLSPFDVLSRLIRAVDPRSPSVPPALAEATAMWQRVSRGRRLLLVLDNAADEAQVGAVVPGDGPAVTIVTSRRMLRGLGGVDRLPLAPLTEQDSVSLLGRLTAGRTATSSELQQLAELCAHMPLAMRVVGNRLSSRRYWTAADVIARLAPGDRRLDALTAGDLQVNAAFALSYDQLSPDAQRLFRRLPLAAGATTGVETAAVLMDRPVHETEDLLDELTEVSLLDEASPGRVRCHDLLRAYGERKLGDEEPPEQIEAVRQRLRTWLLTTTITAGQWFEPEPDPAAPTGIVSSEHAAEAWLQAEADTWFAALRQAFQAGEHRLVVDVAESLHWYSDRWIYWPRWHDIFSLSTEAARLLGDDRVQAVHLGYLAWTRLVCLIDYDKALQHADQAFELASRAGDVSQMGWARTYRSRALARLGGRAEEQLTAARQAVGYFTEAGDWIGVSAALIGQGITLHGLGRHEEALAAFERAVAVAEDPATATIESITAVTVANALHYAALVHVELRQWETVVQVTTRALQASGLSVANPVRTWVMQARAQAYRELGDLPAARADLEAVREIKKVDGDATGLREVEEELRALS